jgi:hypothetical protein
MLAIHIGIGISLIAANLIAGVWGGVAWVRHRPAVGFWYALRFAQALVFLQAALGMALLFAQREASELHYVYGGLPLLVSFLAELTRVGAAQQELGDTKFRSLPEEEQQEVALAIVRREMGIMAVSCLVISFLALRAVGTTPLL